jgi:hypothetical protein
MGLVVLNNVKTAIVRVSNNKEHFVKEVIKASKVLLPHEKEKLINWLFFFTADKPEAQKWLYEVLDKDILVS